jgi:hypothetical protein
MGAGVGIGNTDVYDSPYAGVLRSLDQHSRVVDRRVKRETAAGEADPVGVVEYVRPFEVGSHLLGVAEVERSGAHLTSEGVGPVGSRGQGLDPHPHRQQPVGDVLACVAKRTGDDAHAGGGQLDTSYSSG